MPIEKPDYTLPEGFQQLALDLEVEEVEGSGVSEQERRLRSETARAALEAKKPEDIPWLEDYLRLREGGWPWRQSAFIAWSSQPHGRRVPSKQDDLARMLGLTSDRAFSTWRKKNPAIDETISVLQSAPLFDRRADIFSAMIESATNNGYKGFHDRKLAFEMSGDYIPSAKLAAIFTKRGMSANDMAELSTEELHEMASAIEEVAKGKGE